MLFIINKNLAILIDFRLSWSDHIEKIRLIFYGIYKNHPTLKFVLQRRNYLFKLFNKFYAFFNLTGSRYFP